MKIVDIKENVKDVNMELKIIYDQMPVKEMFGKKIKSVVVAEIDGQKGDPTAILDLWDEDIFRYAFGDKIRIVNCFAKLVTNKRGVQPIINYGHRDNQKIGHYEKIL